MDRVNVTNLHMWKFLVFLFSAERKIWYPLFQYYSNMGAGSLQLKSFINVNSLQTLTSAKLLIQNRQPGYSGLLSVSDFTWIIKQCLTSYWSFFFLNALWPVTVQHGKNREKKLLFCLCNQQLCGLQPLSVCQLRMIISTCSLHHKMTLCWFHWTWKC